MARPQVRRPAAPAPAPAVEGEEAALPTGAELADDLQTLMSELAGSSSSKVTVYRYVRGQQLAYVFACSPDAFSLDVLRDKYNGGDFRLFISKDGVLWKNRAVSVEPKQTAGASEPAPTQSAELGAVMREGFAKQAAMMAEALRAIAMPAPAPVSPFAGIDIPAAITAVSALLATLRPPPAPPPIQQNGGTDKAIDMLLKGIDLARELKSESGGDGETSMLSILREFIKSPMLAQAVSVAAQPPAAPVRPALARPPQAPPVQQPAQSFASATPAAPPMNMLLTQYLGMLVKKAEEGSDPVLYADLVLDSLDEETLRALLVRPPSAVDALIADFAPVAQHRDWFQQLIDAIVAALASDGSEVAQFPIDNTGQDHAAGHTPPSVPGGDSAG
jgi:hypothetical protein